MTQANLWLNVRGKFLGNSHALGEKGQKIHNEGLPSPLTESFKLLVLTVIPPKILYNLTANFSDLLGNRTGNSQDA